MLRKTIATLLALVLCAGMLTACGKAQTAEGPEGEAPAVEAPAEEGPGPGPETEAADIDAIEVDETKKTGVSLDSIPELANKEPIHIMVEASGSGDTIVGFLEKFSEKTGVPVTHEKIAMASAYSKQLLELQSGSGAYDAIMVETTWTNEWKDYLVPIGEMAKEYDPGGEASLDEDLANYDPGLLRCATTSEGQLMGLPYYSYPLLQYIRGDVWTHPEEMANFKEKYGYDLAPATDWQQVTDQAEFFTRKKGDTLKGEVLEKDIYGTGQMGGRFTHVQDEIEARLWGQGGNFATPTRDASGKITEWVYTKKDRELLTKACEEYVRDMAFSHPDSGNAFWDHTGPWFADGDIMFMYGQYNGLWSWMVTALEEQVPGGTVLAAPVPGMRPYTGGFFFGAVKESKNLEAVYWLSRYLTSYEAQYQMPQAGGWPISRFDVLRDAKENLDEASYHEAFGYGEVQMETAAAQLDDINDYIHFNSAAAGKLYDIMTDLFHENANGIKTPEQVADEWGSKFVEIQNQYDSAVPARIEE